MIRMSWESQQPERLVAFRAPVEGSITQTMVKD